MAGFQTIWASAKKSSSGHLNSAPSPQSPDQDILSQEKVAVKGLLRLAGCSLPTEVHLVLYPERLLGSQGPDVPEGHRRTRVPELLLNRLRIARFPEPLDRARVAKDADRAHPVGLRDPRRLEGSGDDLMGA